MADGWLMDAASWDEDGKLILNEEDIELLDIQEQADIVGKLTPAEFAKLIGVRPQMVYYHIRRKHMEIERCQCGRKVIDVAKAREVFKK